ncbi:MAG: hypothetical protein HKL90_10185 [Elusimicrobia bacterium]|nr:hypothetical protein [Elusimicrobiota bacterium]
MAINAAQLRREIEEVFALVPYPGDDGIVGHKCWECDEVLAQYKGKRWQDYKDRPLDLVGPPNRQACSFFTPEAFRYYAPLAMLAASDFFNEADLLTDYFIWNLSPWESDMERTAENAVRLAAFAPTELRVLLLFLDFLKDRHPLDYVTGPKKGEVASLRKAITTRLEGAKKENIPRPEK